MHERFERFARRCAKATGSPYAFAIAVLVTVAWLLIGPVFHFSDTWQLLYNTITTMSTGLIVFLIQGAQNRRDAETDLKLSEIILRLPQTRSEMATLRDVPSEKLEQLAEQIVEEAKADEPST